MDDTEGPQRVEIALAQAKRVRREAGILVQMLGGLRDTLTLQPEGHKENQNGRKTSSG